MLDRSSQDLTPLVVDLDGTLMPADVSLESFLRFIRQGWFNIFLLALWLAKGRCFAKAMVARRTPVAASALSFRPEVVALIDDARMEGRPVILASGSHQRNVARIAKSSGLFDHHLGSTARRNLTGNSKLEQLKLYLDGQPFDYIGDSKADLPLWHAARKAYSTRLIPNAKVQGISTKQPKWRAMRKSLRPHQWAKNALIFVPVATAGLVFDPTALMKAAIATISFSLIASAIYQVNDLMDMEADRNHPKKRHRPLAAGTLSIPQAMVLATLLLVTGFALAFLFLPIGFTGALAVYLGLTTAYSFRLKAAMTLDVIALACLYTLRVMAGALAIAVPLSFWLLAFSLFFFLSLGYMKRYTELAFHTVPHKLLDGRGYVGSDLDIVAMSGVSAGMVSILVMGLFIQDISESGVYPAPHLLWGICIGLLYWINRVWMMARRGEVDGDPVAFAIKDRRSIIVAIFMGVIFLASRFVPLGLIS
jgi:4-hydroxybenzoate polyprenyltransferase